MLPANLISTLQTLSRSGTPLVTAATDAAVPKLEPGQKVQGTVQSQVSEGVFKVQVAGQTLQMRLPGSVQSGDLLNLQVVSTSPRLTFSIAASANPISNPEQIAIAAGLLSDTTQRPVERLTVQQSRGTAVWQAAEQTPEGKQPAGELRSALPEQISTTARLLSDITQRPMEKAFVQQAGSAAVWQVRGQAPDPKQLAGALKDALGNSGLFYESHQAQWVSGERSTAQLLVEPQNQLPDKQNQLPDKSIATFTTDQPAPPQGKAATDSTMPIAKELLPLVQQQLHTLENHQLTWVGQVWPGQQMQWEIQGQPEQHPRQQEERQWSTEMELALPKLGDVHAKLVFGQGGVKLTLHAADTATVALFNRAMPSLHSALSENDLPLTAVIVEKS